MYKERKVHAKSLNKGRICLKKLYEREVQCTKGRGEENICEEASMNGTHEEKSLNEGKIHLKKPYRRGKISSMEGEYVQKKATMKGK